MITRAALPRTLSPDSSFASSQASGSTRTISPPRLVQVTLRSTRPRERCASPTSATDSRYEHPACRPIPAGSLGLPRTTPSRDRVTFVRPSCRDHLPGRRGLPPASGFRPAVPMNRRVELRLTAKLQLRLHHNHRFRYPRRKPRVRPDGHRAVLAGPRSKAPPRRASRRRCFSPRRACRSTSDALCRSSSLPRSFDRAAPTPARPLLHRGLVKDHAAAGTRTPSAAEYPRRRSSADPPPCPWLGRHEPASSAVFAFRAPPGRLDPPHSTTGGLRVRRFSSTSATRTACEHNHVSLDLRPTCRG